MTYYELWDDRTGNRVGGTYATEAEARNVLRVNGPEVASEMAILAFHRDADGTFEPTIVLEGADFVAEMARVHRSGRRRGTGGRQVSSQSALLLHYRAEQSSSMECRYAGAAIHGLLIALPGASSGRGYPSRR